MEPTFLPKRESQRFNSEAEYRLWRVSLRDGMREAQRPGLFRRAVSGVNQGVTRISGLFTREERPAPAHKHRTQTMARVDSTR